MKQQTKNILLLYIPSINFKAIALTQDPLLLLPVINHQRSYLIVSTFTK